MGESEANGYRSPVALRSRYHGEYEFVALLEAPHCCLALPR